MILEQTILKLPDCFVYKIPPIKSASGHRAEDWNLEKPLFTGYLKVYQADIKLYVRIFKFKERYSRLPEDNHLMLFAECPIEIQPMQTISIFIDSVIDSSRYFALRVQDPKTSKTALIGIGFEDRESAFELRSCLNEYIRYVNRMQKSGDHTKEKEENDNEREEDDDSVEKKMGSTLVEDTKPGNLGLLPGERIVIKSLAGRDMTKKKVSPFSSLSSRITPTTSMISSDQSSPNQFSNITSNMISIPDEEWGEFEEAKS